MRKGPPRTRAPHAVHVLLVVVGRVVVDDQDEVLDVHQDFQNRPLHDARLDRCKHDRAKFAGLVALRIFLRSRNSPRFPEFKLIS